MMQNACSVATQSFNEGSHLPREFSRIAWYFLARWGEISVEVIGRRRHCEQLRGGMEIPCQLDFNCSNKLPMKCLKELMSHLFHHVGIVPHCWPIERTQCSPIVGHSKGRRYRLYSSQEVEVHFLLLTLFLACFATSSLKTIDYT